MEVEWPRDSVTDDAFQPAQRLSWTGNAVEQTSSSTVFDQGGPWWFVNREVWVVGCGGPWRMVPLRISAVMATPSGAHLSLTDCL
jgi:hypothetical protein